MTAGIVVMNSGAVALAADSVATIPYELGTKHYRAATKVLGLHDEAPVAVFWYGNPDYVGMPWEVIVKEFRRSNSVRRPHLKEYARAFFDYLDGVVDSWAPNHGSDASDQSDLPAATLLKRLLDNVRQATDGVPTPRIGPVVEETIAKWKQGLRPSAEVLDPTILDDYHELWAWFDQSLAEFGTLPSEASSALRDAAHFAWSCLSSKEPGHTGIVFAGFGDEEQLPSMCHYLVGLPVGNHPRRKAAKRAVISSSHPAAVIPFAQNDQIRLFMEGLHPNFLQFFEGALSQLQMQYNLDPLVVEGIKKRLAYQINRHGHPVVDAVRFLPKAELAEFARSLIAFTEFRLKMSLSDESVGGPIDVAVISRGEGMVWVHRSHYFSADLNPHFMRRFHRPSY